MRSRLSGERFSASGGRLQNLRQVELLFSPAPHNLFPFSFLIELRPPPARAEAPIMTSRRPVYGRGLQVRYERGSKRDAPFRARERWGSSKKLRRRRQTTERDSRFAWHEEKETKRSLPSLAPLRPASASRTNPRLWSAAQKRRRQVERPDLSAPWPRKGRRQLPPSVFEWEREARETSERRFFLTKNVFVSRLVCPVLARSCCLSLPIPGRVDTLRARNGRMRARSWQKRVGGSTRR